MEKQKKRRLKFRTKWRHNPKETCPKDEQGNNANIVCFVSSCRNRMWHNGKKNSRNIFFKVPDGLDGLLWTKAIRKIGVTTYKRLLDDVLNPGAESTNSYNNQYCCEAHFDVSQSICLFYSILIYTFCYRLYRTLIELSTIMV